MSPNPALALPSAVSRKIITRICSKLTFFAFHEPKSENEPPMKACPRKGEVIGEGNLRTSHGFSILEKLHSCINALIERWFPSPKDYTFWTQNDFWMPTLSANCHTDSKSLRDFFKVKKWEWTTARSMFFLLGVKGGLLFLITKKEKSTLKPRCFTWCLQT